MALDAFLDRLHRLFQGNAFEKTKTGYGFT